MLTKVKNLNFPSSGLSTMTIIVISVGVVSVLGLALGLGLGLGLKSEDSVTTEAPIVPPEKQSVIVETKLGKESLTPKIDHFYFDTISHNFHF